MQQLYQDSMALVRHSDNPSLFITFKATPQWVEIEDNLLPGPTAIDCPNLEARVFNLMLGNLMDLIKHEQVFSAWRGWVCTIEYEKQRPPPLYRLLCENTQTHNHHHTLHNAGDIN